MAKRKFYLEELKPNVERQFLSVRRKHGPLGGRFATSLHWHDYYEIELITGGSGTHILNGESYSLGRGCAYLLCPKDFHTVIESEEEPLELYNINFNEQILPPEILHRLTYAERGIAVSFDEEETRRLSALCEQMLAEEHEGAAHSRELLSALFVQLVITLIRHGMKSTDSAEKKLRQPQVGRVVAHLKAHFREPITLAECARMVYLTPNYLGEIFYLETGVRFQDYLRRLRFDYAVDLLRMTDVTVDALSYHAGFPSASYFASLFRREYGMTPTQYRATLKGRGE